MVTIRKIAARVSGADTGCATTTSVSEVASAMRSLARVFMSGRRMAIKGYLSMTFGGCCCEPRARLSDPVSQGRESA